MGNIVDYIDRYGSKSFNETAFNEIDALVLSQLSYVDFSAIVCKFDSDVEISLSEASYQFFNLHDEEEIQKKISIVYKAAMLLKQCAKTKRYKNIKLLKYENNINDKIDKQFSAITFYRDCIQRYRHEYNGNKGISYAKLYVPCSGAD